MIISGTGHRPKSLPGEYNELHPWQMQVRKDLVSFIGKNKPELIIAGGAMGWDMWLGEIALDQGIPLELYIPFDGHDKMWDQESKKRLQHLIKNSRDTTYFAESHNNRAYHYRNQQMIDDSDMVVSLLKPESTTGGTYSTVMYAQRKKKPRVNFWIPRDFKDFKPYYKTGERNEYGY